MKGMPGAQSGIVAIMRIFGVTRQGNSICCHVHGFAPYFYAAVPAHFQVCISLCKQLIIKNQWLIRFFFQPGQVKPFQEALNKAMVADSKKQDIQQIVLEVEHVMKESMYGFNEMKKTPFLKVTYKGKKY